MRPLPPETVSLIEDELLEGIPLELAAEMNGVPGEEAKALLAEGKELVTMKRNWPDSTFSEDELALMDMALGWMMAQAAVDGYRVKLARIRLNTRLGNGCRNRADVETLKAAERLSMLPDSARPKKALAPKPRELPARAEIVEAKELPGSAEPET